MRTLTILVVDDEKLQRETLASILTDQDYTVTTAHDVPSAVAAMAAQSFDVVISDFRMPGGSGVDVARRANELCPDSATLIMTAYADVNGVIDAMRAGVIDYLLKPLNVEALLRRLTVLKDRRALEQEVTFLRAEITKIERVRSQGSLLGDSPVMHQIRGVLAQVAQSRGTVLITGESGTGKEVVAREIHRSSPQAKNKFVAVNCGALPENLLESELFGHKKGAFTGALADKPGLFAVAHDGTLFLDEIGEMPKNLQVKLLRALQEREIVPVGDTKPIKVNIRVVTATNKDLAVEVAHGRFRQDLYYRINVVEIQMPPLRERKEDIPTLTAHFLTKHAQAGRPPRALSADALRRLIQYPWPGNVRELENVVERALILSKDPERIDVADLPLGFQDTAGSSPGSLVKLDDAVREFSRQHILTVLHAVGGDKKEAAKALGMGLSSLYRKLEELGAAVKRE